MKTARAGPLVVSLLFIGMLFVAPAQAQWPLDTNENYVPDPADPACDVATAVCTPAEETLDDECVIPTIRGRLMEIEALLDPQADVFNAGGCNENGYWEGPNVTTENVSPPPVGVPSDLDGLWDTVQGQIDAAFAEMAQELAPSLPCQDLGNNQGSLCITFTNLTQDGDTTILDRDGDGSADAWRLRMVKTLTGAQRRDLWLQSDFIWGSPANLTGMIMTQQPAPDDLCWNAEHTCQGADATFQAPKFRVVNLKVDTADAPNVLRLLLTATQNSNTTHTIITIDTVKLAAADDTAVVISTIDPTDRYVDLSTRPRDNIAGKDDTTLPAGDPDGGLTQPFPSMESYRFFYAPVDLNYLLPLRPQDIDGDGQITTLELLGAEEEEHGGLAANPFNFFSRLGDADGDGCPYADEGEQDKERGLSGCFPFLIDLGGLEPLAGATKRVIFGNVPVTLDITNTTAPLYSDEESQISSYRIWFTKTNNPAEKLRPDANKNTGAVDDVCTGGAIDVTSSPFVIPCLWDTELADDTADQGAPGSPTTGINYVWVEVCIVGNPAGSPCLLSGPKQVIIQNLPSLVQNAFADAVDGSEDDDRDNWISDDGILNITSTHPGFGLDRFEIKVVPCRRNSDGSISCAPFTGTDARTFVVPVTDERANLTDPEEGHWELTFDTNKFPMYNASGPPGSVGSNWAGNRFRITTFSTNGLGRTGVTTDTGTEQLDFPNGGRFQVFNNRLPEITGEMTNTTVYSDAFDLIPSVRFGFHYLDQDGSTGTPVVNVTVDGDVVSCAEVPPGTLGSSQPNYDANYQCTWNPGSRLGAYDWTVNAADPDRTNNTTARAWDFKVDLAPVAPTLNGYPPEAGEGSTSETQDYVFKVHYQHPTHAPKHVNLTVYNTTMGFSETFPMTENILDCFPQASVADYLDHQQLEILLGGTYPGKSNNHDFCATVPLGRGVEWSYNFTAVDVRGGFGEIVELVLDVVECPDCTAPGAEFDGPQSEMHAQIQAFNAAGHVMPASSWDAYPPIGVSDSDGDFVPTTVERALLETSIFTVDETSRVMQLEESWAVAVKRADGISSALYDVVRVQVNSDPADPFIELTVCLQENQCSVDNQDLGYVSYQKSPDGYEVEAFLPNGTRVLHVVIDPLNLNSEGEPVVHIEIFWAHRLGLPQSGSTYGGKITIDVHTNPFDIKMKGTNTFAPIPTSLYNSPVPATAPRFGYDENDDGENVVWIDPDGSGPADRLELTTGEDFTDLDGDGMAQHDEVIQCLQDDADTDADGFCTDPTGLDFFLIDWHPPPGGGG